MSRLSPDFPRLPRLSPGQSRGRESAVGRKTNARARFPRYAGDDGSRRRRALQRLRALDRGLPSAALFRICGASKRRCRLALAIGLGSGSALCVPAQSMLLSAGAACASNVTQGQDGVLPTLKVPLIEVPARIETVGALTTMSLPFTIRFGPRVAVAVASRVCAPESVWFARTRSAGQPAPGPASSVIVGVEISDKNSSLSGMSWSRSSPVLDDSVRWVHPQHIHQAGRDQIEDYEIALVRTE